MFLNAADVVGVTDGKLVDPTLEISKSASSLLAADRYLPDLAVIENLSLLHFTEMEWDKLSSSQSSKITFEANAGFFWMHVSALSTPS